VNTHLPLNIELIEARIREINDSIQMLRDLTTKKFRELSTYEKLSIRYLLIQLVEASSSLCTHILINLFNETSEGFPECFIRLGTKGVIPENLATKLASAARLRNLLVHRYWVIDDEKIYHSVRKGIKDFEDFASYVNRLTRERT